MHGDPPIPPHCPHLRYTLTPSGFACERIWVFYPPLADAKKEWGGLVRSYYRPRYALFVSMAVDCLVHNASWSQAAFSDAVFKQVELPWQTDFASTPGFSVEPETDLIVTATMLYGKYA